MDGKPVGELHEGQLIWNRRWGLDDASSEPWPRETLVNGVENSMLYTLPECTYFTHVQTCNVTRVQSATEWTASVHTLHMSTCNEKSGAWKTGGLSSHRCWPQNTVRVVNHTEKKKTKKSMIPISGSKWWFCHSEIKDYMFSWDGKSPAGCFTWGVFPQVSWQTHPWEPETAWLCGITSSQDNRLGKIQQTSAHTYKQTREFEIAFEIVQCCCHASHFSVCTRWHWRKCS